MAIFIAISDRIYIINIGIFRDIPPSLCPPVRMLSFVVQFSLFYHPNSHLSWSLPIPRIRDWTERRDNRENVFARMVNQIHTIKSWERRSLREETVKALWKMAGEGIFCGSGWCFVEGRKGNMRSPSGWRYELDPFQHPSGETGKKEQSFFSAGFLFCLQFCEAWDHSGCEPQATWIH